MSRSVSPTLIGAFVAGVVGLLVAGILIISGGQLLLTDKSSYVLYFQGSVKGLNTGSPVSFRGVNIGTVNDIQIVVGDEVSDIQIPVIIEIDNTRFISSRTGKPRMADHDSIDELIQAGLRAQLQLQSLLTGQLFIQIDFYPDTPVHLVSNGRRHYQEIPTIPTPIEKIGKLLEGIPIKEVLDHVLAGIKGVDRLVNSEELHQSITVLHQALDDFRRLVTNLDRQVGPVAANVNETLADTRDALRKAGSALEDAGATLEQANTTLRSADRLLTDEQILSALDKALDEIASAAYAIRILAETINNQPESLLKGRH